ncbi:transcription factor [Pimephales promelas]|nr:transcription factor [Pimephales promelas]
MSSRALRRLKGEQRAQAALHELKLTEEDDKGEDEQMKTNTQTAQKQKNISNIFELNQIGRPVATYTLTQCMDDLAGLTYVVTQPRETDRKEKLRAYTSLDAYMVLYKTCVYDPQFCRASAETTTM